MVRVTNAVARNRSRKRLMKRAKGFVGDRKNHKRLTLDAVLSAMAFNYRHRKQRKRDFRKLWIMRIGVGAKINGISYSKLVDGLKRAQCTLNRKVLSDMAIRDPNGFSQVVGTAKQALA
ncbi:MAG: 50S ribosomal protein L20 [Chlamydiales bacterium]|nr:50S ribosomal protein L20 [Chlamydiales bacterium]